MSEASSCVLHVAQSSEYGLGRYLIDLLSSQRERGWRVVMAGNPESEIVAAARSAGVEYVPWVATRSPGRSIVSETRSLARIISSTQPDVVHLHSSKAGVCGRVLLRRRRPTIFQPHGWSFHVPGATQAASRWWERAGARWADAIICVSDQERADAEAAGVAGRFLVVSNAVDLSRFDHGDDAEARADARRRLTLGEGPLAVCIGRLSRQKGQDRLLAAWPLVRDRVPDATVALVGDGEDRSTLERAAPPGVFFAGRREDVLDWLAAADVVVQPSRYEGMSIAVIEALAAGRPVVATDVVGMGELIGRAGEPDAAGVVVDPGDPAALATAVVVRLQDPGLRLREGRAGRERAARSHDLRSWAERMAGIVGEVRTQPRP